MEQPDFNLAESKIAIIGLGLMGGSLALALKGKCAVLYGIDSDRATLELALSKKIVDQADSDPTKLLPQADLVIIATPVPVILDYIQKLPSLTSNSCIVLDLGSTKAQIVSALDVLPERFEVVGGHPICGREKLSLENADSALYQDAPFVLTLLPRTTARALSAAKQLISAIGANELWMDAINHDNSLAFTSHLPFIVSSALASMVPQEVSELIGSGFRSVSRLAATPSSMMLGVLQSNRENVLKVLRFYQKQLSIIETALASKDDAALESILKSAESSYHAKVH